MEGSKFMTDFKSMENMTFTIPNLWQSFTILIYGKSCNILIYGGFFVVSESMANFVHMENNAVLMIAP